MIGALIIVPALAGALCFGMRNNRARRALLVAAAAAHAALAAAAWRGSPAPTLYDWLALDDLGRLFLGITSLLFLVAAVYAVGYLAREKGRAAGDRGEDFLFRNIPEAVFTGCLLLFLSAMTLVITSRHLGLLWAGVEATTLASAPLIHFHRHRRSLEATWKYLVLCSLGIAVALLGSFFLSVALRETSSSSSLVLDDLLRRAPAADVPWLRAAFICLLVGYGTKMGLAPLHSWLPDAHSEAPSVVSALLSGALLNCAFLAILRVLQVCLAAGQGEFARDLLLGFGLFSMATAAVFLVRQPDFKRLLAYSSVEHMGLLAVGVGLGGLGNYGALLHAVSHSLTKGMLFLVAGNILAAYQTKAAGGVRGLLRGLPASGILWTAGLFAIAGSPPFGTFLSEFTLVRAALEQGRPVVAGAMLLLLAVIFAGMSRTMLAMSHGEAATKHPAESFLAVAPPAVLAALALLLGLFIPPPLETTLRLAARALGVPL